MKAALSTALALLVPAGAVAQFDGYPFADTATNFLSWEGVVASLSEHPMGQLVNALNERRAAAGLAALEIVHTYTLAEYTNEWSVTVTNTFGQFVDGGATGITRLVRSDFVHFDAALWEALPYYVATNEANADGTFTNYLTQAPEIVSGSLAYPADFPMETRAGFLSRHGIGAATNQTTNAWGFVTGGEAYFTSEPETEAPWLFARVTSRAARLNASGFGESFVNGYYEALHGADYWERDGGFNYYMGTTGGVYYIRLMAGGVHASKYRNTDGFLSTNWVADGGAGPGGTTTNAPWDYDPSLWINSILGGAATNFLSSNHVPVVVYRPGGDETGAYTVVLDGRAMDWDLGQSQTYASVTVTVTEATTLLDRAWYYLSDVRIAESASNANDVLDFLWTNLTLYGNASYEIQAEDWDERVAVLKGMSWTRVEASQSDGYEATGYGSGASTHIAWTNYAWDATLASVWPASVYRVRVTYGTAAGPPNPQYSFSTSRLLPTNGLLQVTGVATQDAHAAQFYMAFLGAESTATWNHYTNWVWDVDGILENYASNTLPATMSEAGEGGAPFTPLLLVEPQSAYATQAVRHSSKFTNLWATGGDPLPAVYAAEPSTNVWEAQHALYQKITGGAFWLFKWAFDYN